MKKLSATFFLIIVLSGYIGAQVISSGKSSITISNKAKAEQKQKPAPIAAPVVTPIQETVVEKSAAPADLMVGAGKYYALVIGINNYDDINITQLDRPVKDAESFFKVLTTKYTFEPDNVRLLSNATNAEIIKALDYYAGIIGPEDNFLIFYAGHGYWDDKNEIGFWLPSDASKTSKVAWFRNSTLRDYLRAIGSKHTLLISDACFAGSIFKSRNAFSDANFAINRLYELPSRKAMTSGNKEEVPDQSVFVKYLIDRLRNNMDKYMTSRQLFDKFQMAVMNNSKVVPQFGDIQDVGDEGGDFIFILR